MKKKRKFQGVWIPAALWENSALPIMETVFLVEINSLDNELGCFASNKYLGQFFSVTEKHAGRVVSKLVRDGLIERSLTYDHEKNRTRRILKMSDIFRELYEPPLRKNGEAPLRIQGEAPLRKKAETPLRKNAEYSNTVFFFNSKEGRETRILKFLLKENTERFKQWEHQNSSKIDDPKKFIKKFIGRVIIEGIPFNPDKIFFRLQEFLDNWIRVGTNQADDDDYGRTYDQNRG